MIRLAPLVIVAILPALASAQPFLVPGGQQNQGANGFGFGNQQPGGNQQQGQQGGGANADFDSLIDLIVSTVAPDTWAENGGGEAEVRPYVSGVYADAAGVLRRGSVRPMASVATDLDRIEARLASVRDRASEADILSDADPRRPSGLRYVSLAGLGREMTRRLAAGEPVEQAMLTLAGLRRVEYVLLLPNAADGSAADVVLAGPAGDWRVVGDGRIVAVGDQAGRDGAAVVRLDDLLTLLRRSLQDGGSPFGCSIDPRPEALAEAQAYLSASAAKPVAPGRRDAWLEGLRKRVGRQDVVVFGVDPTSRAAGVLVEADHHMKLIGMGIEEGVPGVESYLDQLAKSPKAKTTSTGVLRWWFGMNYSAVRSTPEGDAFQLVGVGAKVMSEKEMLTARGGRVAAAQADDFAEGFASAFTAHFDELCRKYPVYSELRNVFDLALVVEIARAAREQQANAWSPSLFVDESRLPLPKYTPATTVDTVVNHRVVNRRRFVVGVSGGVWSDPRSVLEGRRQVASNSVGVSEAYDPFNARDSAQPPKPTAWWWDAR